MPLATANPFLEQVMAGTPDGRKLRDCIQCGTCGGSCPNGAEMDLTPRELLAWINAGDREVVLSSNTIWQCVSCYSCTSRCPQEVPITDLIYTLKRIAIREGAAQRTEAPALAKIFSGYVDRYGRSFELGLASRYYLSHRPVSAALKMGGLGFSLARRGRVSLTPDRIRDLDQLQAILAKARQTGGEG